MEHYDLLRCGYYRSGKGNNRAVVELIPARLVASRVHQMVRSTVLLTIRYSVRWCDYYTKGLQWWQWCDMIRLVYLAVDERGLYSVTCG